MTSGPEGEGNRAVGLLSTPRLLTNFPSGWNIRLVVASIGVRTSADARARR
jgi:hypothetical protein